jgi:hypothetical protein
MTSDPIFILCFPHYHGQSIASHIYPYFAEDGHLTITQAAP